MFVYGIIVGGRLNVRDYKGEYKDYLSLAYHPHEFWLDKNVINYKGKGLFRCGAIAKQNEWGDKFAHASCVYKFSYEALLNFLVKHLNTTFFEEELYTISSDELYDNYVDEHINKEVYRYERIKDDKNKKYPYSMGKFISCIARESENVYLEQNEYPVEENTLLNVKSQYHGDVPIWAVCLDMTFDRDIETGRFLSKSTKVVDISPISIVLHMISDALDKEEDTILGNVHDDLERLARIADSYDEEEEYFV